MKAQLKRLAPYLPYELRGMEHAEARPYKLTGLNINRDLVVWSPDYDSMEKPIPGRLPTRTDCKPVLHPLSDLTKEINHKGKTFIPANELQSLAETASDEEWISHCIDRNFENMNLEHGPYWFIQKLFEWHFAIDMPEGTWIDINALKETSI